jgi:hypothetical protein
METSNEFKRAQEVLNEQRKRAYEVEINEVHQYEVSEGKFIKVKGGMESLLFLQNGYESMFVDPVTPATSGIIKDSDGVIFTVTPSEWKNLIKLIRSRGSESFYKDVTLEAEIAALVETDTFDKIWNTIWVNCECMDLPS